MNDGEVEKDESPLSSTTYQRKLRRQVIRGLGVPAPSLDKRGLRAPLVRHEGQAIATRPDWAPFGNLSMALDADEQSPKDPLCSIWMR